MSQLREFQVTLPSNASMSIYPNNKPQLYRTELPQPLNLQGEWEVAVIDIQYPYKWRNILTDTELGFFLCNAINPEISANKEPVDNDELETNAGLTEPELDPPTVGGSTIDISIPAGYYAGIQTILTKITTNFNLLAKPLTNKTETIRILYNEISDRIKYISFVPKWDIQIRFDPNSEIAKILALDADVINKTKSVLYLPSESKRPPYFERTSALFIYSDIVQHQVVGDSLVQLIGVAPVKGNPNEQYYWAFNPVMYRPLCKSYIKDIEIQLCSSDGKLIPIIRGNTIIRLHFRKFQNTI